MDVKEREFFNFYSMLQEQRTRVLSSELDKETKLSLLKAIANFNEELDNILIKGK